MKQQNRPIAMIISVLLAFAVFAPACTNSSVPGATAQPAATGTPATPAVFKLSTLTINPAEAITGVQVMVTAKVTNTGSAATTYTPKLRIDNATTASLPTYLYLRDRAIDAGATQQMSFLLSPENPGKYRVTWGELAGEFTVTEQVAATTSSANGTAPDFTGSDVVTGKKISLSDFKGSVILFNFVNYGCDPSVNNVVSKQLLAIRDLKKQRSDFVPLSVFCGCCPAEVLHDFAKQNNLSWPWLLDTNNSIARKYLPYLSKYGYPTLVFIDQDQRIVDSAGYTGLPELSAKIDRIIGKSS